MHILFAEQYKKNTPPKYNNKYIDKYFDTKISRVRKLFCLKKEKSLMLYSL